MASARAKTPKFQSSRSLRTATVVYVNGYAATLFQSSRSLRTATIRRGYEQRPVPTISILAVLADRDIGISISVVFLGVFQSSRSLRTATLVIC